MHYKEVRRRKRSKSRLGELGIGSKRDRSVGGGIVVTTGIKPRS